MLRADIESWCASGPALPQAMRRMMDVTTRFVGLSDEYARVCPVVFESTARISLLTGFEIHSSVQEIALWPPSRPGPSRCRGRMTAQWRGGRLELR